MDNIKRIHGKKIKKVGFVYLLLGYILGPLMLKKYHVHIKDNCNIKKVKEQHIFISNHTSRIDYFFNAAYLLPKKYNFVVGFNEFYRKQFILLANLLRLIPKKNFTPDIYTIKQISRIIKDGGNIFIFPEGMNSISGANQPVAIGTGKMLKHFKLPVYYSKVEGGYLCTPKYALDERIGHIDVSYDIMFSKEDLERLSESEIEDIINEKLYVDHYKWNKEHHYAYKCKGGIANNIHTLLYHCPKCHHEFEMIGKDDYIQCNNCGNKAYINEYYDLIPFDDSCVIPKSPSEWFNLERNLVKKEILDENYYFESEVNLGMLPNDKLIKGADTSLIVGKGILRIDHTGLTYKGSKNNEDFTFHIDIKNLPTYGMCTDTSRFYTFYNGEFVEFYPSKPNVIKYLLLTEEIHRLHNGKWQDFKFEK